MTIVLGIDPGSRHTGYGLIECVSNRNRHIAHGRIDTVAGEMPARLLAIFNGLASLIREYKPDEIAIEETFVNRVNAGSALVLGQARGAAICACAQAGVVVAEYAAAQVKVAIAGNGRAEKQQVQHMVKVLLNLREALPLDASDALAVALTHAHVRGTRLRAGVTLKASWS